METVTAEWSRRKFVTANETVNAALKIAKHPALVSHTGLDTQLGNNESMARMIRPRLISKEQAKIVADAGGVIGVWTHLADTPLQYAQNRRALVDVIGVDHVCIGTDTKLTPAYRSPGDAGPSKSAAAPPQGGGNAGNRQDSLPRKNNQNGPGADKNRNRMGKGTNETWPDQKLGFYYTVVDALLKTGFTADEIGKMGGGNFCRIFDAATAGHQ